MKNVLVTVTTASWILAALLIFTLRPSYAVSPNGLCLTEPEFTNFNTMTEAGIRTWLQDIGPTGGGGGFISAPFTDLDGFTTDVAHEVSEAASFYKINPRVLLTTLRKENPKVFESSNEPTDRTLRTLAGCGSSPTAWQQIWCMAERLKVWFYDELSQCKPTIGGWDVDVQKQTGDTGNETDAKRNPCSVTPESKTIAALFQYTPWVGRPFYGCGYGDPLYPDGVGGNGLFCYFWKRHGWQTTSPGPLTLSPQPLTMSCAPSTPQQPSRCLSINASGGDPGPNGYTWSITGPNLTTAEGVLAPPTGVNRQNVQIRPPANPAANPKSTVSGTAYLYCSLGALTLNSNSCVPLGFSSPVTIGQHFGCADNYLACTHVELLCTDPNLPAFNNRCVNCSAGGLPQTFGQFQVTRTQAQKDDGCRPCRVEMQGATVTVTDAAGAPATTTVTAQ